MTKDPIINTGPATKVLKTVEKMREVPGPQIDDTPILKINATLTGENDHITAEISARGMNVANSEAEEKLSLLARNMKEQAQEAGFQVTHIELDQPEQLWEYRFEPPQRP